MNSLMEKEGRVLSRSVKVNRSRTPQEALDLCDRTQYSDRKIVDAMILGEGDEVQLIFFAPRLKAYRNNWLSPVALEKEFNYQGLAPDPLALVDFSATNPDFANRIPNACQWKDVEGNYGCVTFFLWSGARYVRVIQANAGWDRYWLFAGVPKES